MSRVRSRWRRATWRLRPDVLRAAWWALRSCTGARRQMAAGIAHPTVPPPPRLPANAGIGMDAVLARLEATCLEGAVVRQRWLAAHGIRRDLVIALPPHGFGATPAHAWVDGVDQVAGDYVELYRRPAPEG